MKAVNSFGIKAVACAGVAMALSLGLSWSFVESTAQVRTEGPRHTMSVGWAHGGAPLAPFGAGQPKRSATLVG